MKTTTEPAAEPVEPEAPPEKKPRNPILRFMGELPGLIIIAFTWRRRRPNRCLRACAALQRSHPSIRAA